MSNAAGTPVRPIIALDAMGGDAAPGVTVRGALQAIGAGARVRLVGDEATIERELVLTGPALAATARADGRLHVTHAPDHIDMGEHAARELRSRRGASIYVAMEVLKRGDADAVVTLGNTGAALAAALIVLGRLPGIERPALAALLPLPRGRTLVVDAGANAENRASHLYQFAHLGAAYMQAVEGIGRPRVGLLNIGEEAAKGSPLTIATHDLLQASSLHFAGNIEGRDLALGSVDVVVTDGFTGNVALKLLEGTVSLLIGELRDTAMSSWRGRLGGMLLRPSIQRMRQRLDYRQYGGVPLLGVDGAVFVGHGRSDEVAVANAIRTAADAVSNGLVQVLRTVAREAVVPPTEA